MANLVEVRVPDLGGYKGVDVLEVLVKPGAKVAIDDPLVTLSSDKGVDGRAVDGRGRGERSEGEGGWEGG
jgi:hypothetical protein